MHFDDVHAIFLESPLVIYPSNFKTVTVNEHSDAVFTCKATGIPAPHISFWHNNQALNHNNEMLAALGLADRFVLGTEDIAVNSSTNIYEVARSLTLFNVTNADSGSYLCSSTANIPGIGIQFDNANYNLLVHCEF